MEIARQKRAAAAAWWRRTAPCSDGVIAAAEQAWQRLARATEPLVVALAAVYWGIVVLHSLIAGPCKFTLMKVWPSSTAAWWAHQLEVLQLLGLVVVCVSLPLLLALPPLARALVRAVLPSGAQPPPRRRRVIVVRHRAASAA